MLGTLYRTDRGPRFEVQKHNDTTLLVLTDTIERRVYTVSELEVTNYKRREMIEILNNCCISCLYLQEYKKGFAFLTKCHYFESRGGLN